MSRHSLVPEIRKPTFSPQFSYWYMHNPEGLPREVAEQVTAPLFYRQRKLVGLTHAL